MKKKILILLTFIFCAAISFAQFSPNPQGTAQQLTQFRGAVTGLRGTIITPNDTLNSPATPYYGALTVLPSDAGLADIPIWMSNGLYWIRFAGGSATNINDTIYTRIPIAVDSTTLPGKRILYLLHLDGVVTPGYVIWTGIGLNFNVTPSNYYINYRQFFSPFTTVTLDPAPVSNSRIDLFIVDTTATATKITGTVAVSPLVPQTNPSAQLPLTSITVNAGDTIPAGIGLQTIYDENLGTPTEFQTGSTGTITVDFDNTDNPYWGSKAAFVSTYTDGSALTFTDNVDDTVQNGELLRFFVWINGPFTNQFQFRLYNGVTPLGTAISINTGFGFNPNDTSRWQIVAIPLSSFNVATGTIFTKLVITMAGNDVSGAKGYYLDYMQLQTGINNINPDFTLTTNFSSGASTWDPVTRILNIPIYSGGGGNETMQNTYDNSITAADNPTINGHGNSILIDSLFEFSVTAVDPTSGDRGFFDAIPGNVNIVAQTNPTPTSTQGSSLALNNATFTLDSYESTLPTNAFRHQLVLSPDMVKILRADVASSIPLNLNPRFVIHTDSVATVDNNNIAYFDADTLKRGHIAGAGTPTLPQVLAAGRTVTTDSILSTSLAIRGKTIFDSTTIGTDYTRIGLLLNQNFNTSIPAGWTKGSALTTVYAADKVTITGAAAIGAPAAGALTTAYTSALQYDPKRMPYEKLDFQMSIVPTTKSAGAVVGVAYGNLGLTIYMEQGIFWDLSDGTNSGRVTINTSASTALALPTFTTNIDSTSKMNFSTGDSLVLYFKKNGWGIVAGIINKTTGKTSITTFNQRWNGSGGRWNLVFLNGTYVMTNAKVNVLDRKGGVWFIGDSQDGYGNSQESRRYPNLLFQSNYKYFGVLGQPSLSAKYFVDGGMLAEIISDAAPSKAIVGFGYNDESELFTAPNTKTAVDSIVYPLQRAGVNVGLLGLVPRSNATDIWNDSLQSLATSRGADFYDIRTLLKTSAGIFSTAYNYDGVHINDSGAIVVANVIRAKSGDSLLTEVAADTNYVAKIFSLPNSRTETVAALVGRNIDGSLVNIPNKLPTEAAWIKNNWTSLQGTGTAQANAAVAVSGYVRSDSGLISRGVQGGHIGFYDQNQSNTTGSNFQIVNITDGAGVAQAWANITGNGNFFQMSSSANKVKAQASVISGNNNTVINSNQANTLSGNDNIKIGSYINTTSGSNNILIGSYAGLGAPTGSALLHLATTTTGGGFTLPAGLSNALIIGEAWQYNPRSYLAGDVVISPFYATTPNFWFGGITNTGPTTWNFPGAQGAVSNRPGSGGYIRSSMGEGVAQSGAIYLQTWNNTTTGTTYHSVANTKMMIDFTGIGIGSTTVTTKAADLLFDAVSTTQGIAPPRMTTTDRDLIQTGVQTIAVLAGGSLYTDGNVSLAFSGGAGSGAAGYAVIISGTVTSVVLTARGSGYTSAPTATVTSGPGTGATFTITIGASTGSEIYNTTLNSKNIWNGINWTGDVITSSAGTLTLVAGTDYFFTGTTTTWTLPALSSTITGRMNMITIKNAGSGNITLNSNAGGNDIYNTSAVNSVTIAAGTAATIMPSGTVFYIE